MQRKGVLDDDGLLGLQIGIHETGYGVFHLMLLLLLWGGGGLGGGGFL